VRRFLVAILIFTDNTFSMQDFIQLFTFTSIGFGLLLSFKLLTVKKHGLIVMWLGFYVLLLVGSLCEAFFSQTEILMRIIGMTYWLFGPCLYLYVLDRVGERQLQFFKDCVLHLLPFIVYATFVVVAQLFAITVESEAVEFLLYEVVFAHIIVYFIMALRLISRNGNRSSQEKSSVEKMQRASMLFLVVASLAIFGSSWISTHLFLILGQRVSETYNLLVQVAITLLIFAIALLNTETRYTERMKVL
jgi:hypothetical protein